MKFKTAASYLFSIHEIYIMRNAKNDLEYVKSDPFVIGGHDILELRRDKTTFFKHPKIFRNIILTIKRCMELLR